MIYTDVSGVKGIGGWWENDAYTARIARGHRGKHIDWKEVYAILFAFARWGQWRGKMVMVMCDNSAIVSSLNSRSIKGEAIDPLQLIFLIETLYDIEIHSE